MTACKNLCLLKSSDAILGLVSEEIWFERFIFNSQTPFYY